MSTPVILVARTVSCSALTFSGSLASLWGDSVEGGTVVEEDNAGTCGYVALAFITSHLNTTSLKIANGIYGYKLVANQMDNSQLVRKKHEDKPLKFTQNDRLHIENTTSFEQESTQKNFGR